MSESDGAVPAQLALQRAFAPLHKRAFGLSVGTVSAIAIFGLTVFHITVAPAESANLELLAQYFYGYTVTWPGAFVGAWWGLLTGFVAGWFAAFMHNVIVATWLLVIRVRADLSQTQDFLDHL